MEDRCYYVYEHIRLDNMSTFYVGKGKGNRIYDLKRNNHHDRVVAKYGCAVVIVADNLSENEALELEKEIINDYVFNLGYSINIEGFKKRGDNEYLTNATWGGEGVSGIKFSTERRNRISLMNKKNGKFKGKSNPMYGKKGIDSPHSKPVVMISQKGVVEREFESVAEVNNYFNKNKTNSFVSRACLNGSTAYGYLWLFKDKYDKLKENSEFDTWYLEATERYVNKVNKIKQSHLITTTKEVYQLDKNTLDIINKFESIANASKETNILSKSISRNCRHECNSAGGYSWIYKNEYDVISKEELHRLYSHKYKKPNKECYRNNKVKIICLNTLEVFDGIVDAVAHFNLCKGARLDAVCRGTRKSAGKHPKTNEPLKWMYYNEYLESIKDVNKNDILSKIN